MMFLYLNDSFAFAYMYLMYNCYALPYSCTQYISYISKQIRFRVHASSITTPPGELKVPEKRNSLLYRGKGEENFTGFERQLFGLFL